MLETWQGCTVLHQHFDDSSVPIRDGGCEGGPSAGISDPHACAGSQKTCHHFSLVIKCSQDQSANSVGNGLIECNAFACEQRFHDLDMAKDRCHA